MYEHKYSLEFSVITQRKNVEKLTEKDIIDGINNLIIKYNESETVLEDLINHLGVTKIQ